MAPKKPALLGRLAVHLKMISMDQLAEATRVQGRVGEDAPLGEILIDLGLIDRTQLAKLMTAQQQVIAKHRIKAGASPPAAVAPPAPAVSEAPVAKPAAPESAAAAPPPATPAQPDAVPKAAPAAPQPAPAARPEVRPQAEADAQPATAGLGEATDLATASDSDRESFLELLRSAVARGASDVHIHAGSAPSARSSGVLSALSDTPLEAAAAERMVVSILTPAQRQQLAARGELDVCQTFEGIGRFRANLYQQQRGLDGVFRFISAQPPTLEQLGLPANLAKFTSYHQGMVLVTGPTGSGKSSTLAALVNLINEERQEHILTIEDPIEFLHPSKRCLVNQRSVSHHTQSFPRALRAALREDPDVIVIGELRDLETVSLALTAAETGHLVLATLHTDNAIRTINRLIGSFPADQQEQVRTMCSESLRAVISQRLLPRADGNGRAAALETMVVNKAVGNLIRDNKTFQIHSILQTGSSQGMGLLDQSICSLVEEGTVAREEALRHCDDPKSLAA